MKIPDNRALFTIKEMTEICGISRSSLLRMEEDGFLTPYKINPETGYRYYDMFNVATVGQYQRLQTIGLSRKELADIYYERVDSAAFLAELRAKLNRLQRFINEYEMRHDRSKNFSISYTTLSEVTCRCVQIEGSSVDDFALCSFYAHQNCVKEGFRMRGSEPLTVLFDDPRTCFDPLSTHGVRTLCIPVEPERKDDPRLRFFPAVDALSILGFGSYETLPDLWRRLFDEFERRQLESAGPPRLISLIAQYTGAHYSADDYCVECAIPIRERKD